MNAGEKEDSDTDAVYIKKVGLRKVLLWVSGRKEKGGEAEEREQKI